MRRGPVADRLVAIVQAFFPGQEGAGAIAGVLSGRVVPSGKLPIEVPLHPAAQPAYLAPPLASRSAVSSVDPTPLFPFGHGLSYTTFTCSDLTIHAADQPGDAGAESWSRGRATTDAAAAGLAMTSTGGAVEIACTVTNAGAVAGAEVVQLYLRDPVAQVTRPVRSLGLRQGRPGGGRRRLGELPAARRPHRAPRGRADRDRNRLVAG